MTPNWLACLPAVCDVLRTYQHSMLGRIHDALMQGLLRILAQAPTGSGKTHLIASIAAAATSANLRVLILVTRTRLCRQIHERLDEFHVHHGVTAAALPEYTDHFALCQVASVDTLYRRCMVDERAQLPSADVVIFDEAHLALGSSRVRLMEQYPHAALIGFTATPCKTSGRGLGSMFNHLVCGPTILELISLGALVRPRVFAAPSVTAGDLAKLSTSKSTGDYATGELSQVMRRPRIVGDVVASWLRLAAGRRTMVFACDKAHAQSLVESFLQSGIAAELLTDDDDDDAREEAIARLERGETLVLVNCFLLSYGVDIPSVECISLARPTRSVALYLQAVGRGMRPAPGKESLIVLDHGRVVESLGLPTADFGWSLDGSTNLNASAAKAAARRHTSERPRTCPECSCVWLVREDGPACPSCSWQPTPIARNVVVEAGELAEVGGISDGAPDPAEVRHFVAQAIGFYARRWPERWTEKPNGARWWAWSQAVNRFDLDQQAPMPPSYWRLSAINPTAQVSGWLTSRVIAYAKARRPRASV